MSRIEELFAPPFVVDGQLTAEAQEQMAVDLGADSLRYLPVDSIARAIDKPAASLCRACVTGDYPSPWGKQLYQLACQNQAAGVHTRTYETAKT